MVTLFERGLLKTFWKMIGLRGGCMMYFVR